MVEITVCGQARRRASAERASVTVHVRHNAPSAEQALHAVTQTHERLVADAQGHEASGAADAWHADRVWITHHEEWVGEGQPRNTVYAAAASVTVRFVDADVLGGWLGAVGVLDGVEVGGIDWSLAEATERQLAADARGAAIADAVQRARDYATAAGLGAPTIDGIREPGAAAPAGPVAKARMESMAFAADVGTGPAVSLRAGEVEVHAAVEVRFAAQ